MPRASRKPIRNTIAKEIDDNFAFLISSLRNSAEIQQFFTDFLTREEKIMLGKRLMLHLMLENKYKPSQIELVLGMSRETIRVHHHIWRLGGEYYKKVVKSISRRQKVKEFWKQVEKILVPIDLAIRSRNDMRARAKFASGQWFDD